MPKTYLSIYSYEWDYFNIFFLSTGKGNPCVNGECSNSPGGFSCRCHSGFVLGPDGRTCSDSILSPCYAVVR